MVAVETQDQFVPGVIEMRMKKLVLERTDIGQV